MSDQYSPYIGYPKWRGEQCLDIHWLFNIEEGEEKRDNVWLILDIHYPILGQYWGSLLSVQY